MSAPGPGSAPGDCEPVRSGGLSAPAPAAGPAPAPESTPGSDRSDRCDPVDVDPALLALAADPLAKAYMDGLGLTEYLRRRAHPAVAASDPGGPPDPGGLLPPTPAAPSSTGWTPLGSGPATPRWPPPANWTRSACRWASRRWARRWRAGWRR